MPDENVTTVEEVAEAVDNPAQTVVATAEEAITPEPVQEVIEEHKPKETSIDNGLQALQDAINKRLDGIEALLKDKPQTQPQPKKEETTDGTQIQTTVSTGSGREGSTSKRGGFRFRKRG